MHLFSALKLKNKISHSFCPCLVIIKFPTYLSSETEEIGHTPQNHKHSPNVIPLWIYSLNWIGCTSALPRERVVPLQINDLDTLAFPGHQATI